MPSAAVALARWLVRGACHIDEYDGGRIFFDADSDKRSRYGHGRGAAYREVEGKGQAVHNGAARRGEEKRDVIWVLRLQG